MKVKLLSHVNGDGDLIEAWLKYYIRLGVSSFHLVVHGTREENARLFALKDSYSVKIEDQYEGTYHIDEKKKRLDSLLGRMRGQWVMLADSDEFVELPYRRIPLTIRVLQLARANVLFAPMIQRLSLNGSLDSPRIVEDPFRAFPLCSIDLYRKMGATASIAKYPLFFCTDRTLLHDGGHHNPPVGEPPLLSLLQGVTHHFKFRSPVLRRLDARINTSHPWRQESVQYMEYLKSHSYRLPTEDSFAYSRSELFDRGLLHRATFGAGLRLLRRRIIGEPKWKADLNP